MKISGLMWALLFAAGGVEAAGLGKLSVQSALGQPLKAEIELLSVNKDELPGITASLAGADAFRQARIDRIAALGTLRFSIEQRANGQPVIRVSSSAPIADPFLDLLIEVNWNSGRLLREYTILLDPPAEARAAVPVQPIALPEVARPAPALAPERRATTESFRPKAPEPAPAPTRQAKRYGPVKSGETLRGIAAKVKDRDVTLEQMMVSLYRANQDAFLADNMNRLKRGRVLNVPDAEAVHLQVSPSQAINAVRGHTADWHAYRRKVAEMAVEAPAAKMPEAAVGKLAPKAEEKAPAAATPRDMLKLSKGEPGVAGRADGKTQEKLHALEEEVAAKGRALQEAQDRVGQLERAVRDMQKLLEMRAQEPGKPAPAVEPAVVAPAPPPPVAMPEVEQAPVAPPPAPPVAKPVPVALPEPVQQPSSSWISTFISNPLYIGGIVAAVLLSVLLWMMMVGSRRRHGLNKFEDSIMTGGEFKNNAVFNSASAGGGAAAGANTEGSMLLTDFSRLGLGAIDTHEVDPIAEAEVYMAYGRDAQAEEILKEALGKDPSRHEIALKLLEIYAARKDIQAFETVSSELYASLGGLGPVWQRAAEMGRSIDPSNPLYRATASEMPAASVFAAKPANRPAAAMPVAAAPLDDFSRDEGPMDDWDTPSAPAGRDMDFDLPSAPAAASFAPREQTPSPQSPARERYSAVPPEDDFALEFESSPPAAAVEPEELAWEMPSSPEPEPLPAAEPEMEAEPVLESYAVSEAPAWDEQGIDLEFEAAPVFDEAPETGKVPEVAEEQESMPVLDLSGIDLELESEPEPVAPEEVTAFEVPAPTEREQEIEAFAPVDEFAPEPVDEFAPEVIDEFAPEPVDEFAPEAVDEFMPADDIEPVGLVAETPTEPEPVAPAAAAAPAEPDVVDPELWEEVNTKIDLARAYLEMGDQEGAREILHEVLGEGDPQQKAEADKLLSEAG
ncbi:MAG: FimV/HubP family polar landmark protein [Pseudomonadota bacterium]|nr:FimV/HubP family polar landmark protein [Pseudomonadota bacterium]